MLFYLEVIGGLLNTGMILDTYIAIVVIDTSCVYFFIFIFFFRNVPRTDVEDFPPFVEALLQAIRKVCRSIGTIGIYFYVFFFAFVDNVARFFMVRRRVGRGTGGGGRGVADEIFTTSPSERLWVLFCLCCIVLLL